MILEVKGLTTTFQSAGNFTKAVDDISFHVNKGETLGIVGESGSGKTVTSLSMLGLIQQQNGKIESGSALFHSSKKNNTVDLLSLKEKELRTYRGNEMAMIFQEPMTSLNPVFTCGDQVAEAIRVHNNISQQEAKEKTIRLFEKVKLPRTAMMFESYPHQISGGQKQRVMIAMAISCNPSLLIADEPTTALDVTVQKNILDLLKELQQETGMSIIFISHDLGVISELANRVLVMYKGKIVEEGNTKSIFQNPQHPYTKGLISCRPPVNVKIKKLPTVIDFMEEKNGILIKRDNVVVETLRKDIVTKEETDARNKKLYDQTPVLSLEDVKKYFPVNKGLFRKNDESIKAVDGITLDVYPGETLGLAGESGCGKTTLGRVILLLLKPTSGKIIFKGKDLAALPDNEMRQMRKYISVIFQDPHSSLNPRMTIGNAVMEPMQVHKLYGDNKTRKEKVLHLFEKVSLSKDFFDRYPHEFSSGQRQRICIARALAVNPEFIICDEAVSSLDVSVQAQVLNVLNELKSEFNFSCIFISHDLSVVKFMSDRIAIMNNGKLEEIGLTDDIYNHPKTEYTQKLIAAIPKTLN